mmetsp:Transcript_134134/g.232872  ORF Transcript_134134/g.232872 Transcript_134134/m.232872 type:complete len:200 (+) Transcript_134134:1598-2197(+)
MHSAPGAKTLAMPHRAREHTWASNNWLTGRLCSQPLAGPCQALRPSQQNLLFSCLQVLLRLDDLEWPDCWGSAAHPERGRRSRAFADRAQLGECRGLPGQGNCGERRTGAGAAHRAHLAPVAALGQCSFHLRGSKVHLAGLWPSGRNCFSTSASPGKGRICLGATVASGVGLDRILSGQLRVDSLPPLPGIHGRQGGGP